MTYLSVCSGIEAVPVMSWIGERVKEIHEGIYETKP